MTLSGSRAIEFLATASAQVDRDASSHWRQVHADFRFTGDGFEGLRGGFGGSTPRHAHRRFGHWLLQRPFRAMAAAWPAFPALDALAHRVVGRLERQPAARNCATSSSTAPRLC